MKALIALMMCAATFAFTGVTRAAEISSAGIFGVVFQFWAECAVVNGGKTALPVTVKIVGNAGQTLESGTCDGPLSPGEICVVGAGWQDGLPLDDGFPISCTATAPSVANLRGALTINERVNDGFGGVKLMPMRSTPLR